MSIFKKIYGWMEGNTRYGDPGLPLMKKILTVRFGIVKQKLKLKWRTLWESLSL